jgi:hypothetical protein
MHQSSMTVLTVEPRINTCFNPPTRGLFLTSTKGMFFLILDTHITVHVRIIKYIKDCLDEKPPSLEWQLFVHGCKSPSLLVPCSESTASFQNPPLLCTLPHSPSSRQFSITIHTDNSNMPESSYVGHTSGIRYCAEAIFILSL